MNVKNITLSTLIPQYPGILNYNNQEFKRYLDVFYSETKGVVIVPINTPGRVKAATAEFVTAVVDNLIVKNQFTNLYDNNTTADYNFYKLYIDPAVQPRDPCLGPDYWPEELSGFKYVNVNKPYYKIQNITQPYVFVNDNLSQVVGIFLDPSLVSASNQFQVILDPHTPYQYFTADASAAGDPSMGTGYYVEFIATAYDPSYGTTWAQYKQGLPITGTGTGGSGSGSGTVGPGTINTLPIFTGPSTVTDSPLKMIGSLLYTYNLNVDGTITLTNKKITGVATPTNPTDAVNLSYADQFVSNTSVNDAFAEFIKSSSVGNTLVWNAGILDVSINVSGISFTDMKTYVDSSLGVRDGSITNLYAIKANNASLGLYATNASIGLAAFAKNASLGLYATNVSVNTAIGLRDTSIAWLNTNKVSNTSLGIYATNVSVNAAFVTTNASFGRYATSVYVDGSLARFIRSASTGSSLKWTAGVLDVSINTSGTDFAYVDGSLLARDTSIIWLQNNKVNNASMDEYLTETQNSLWYARQDEYIPSVSTGSTLKWVGGFLDVSLSVGISQLYVDGSLLRRDTSIAWLNTNKANNASLGLYVTNSSVNNALKVYTTNASVGLAGFATNASVGIALTQFIRSASTGTGLVWNAGTLNVDVNLTGASESYVNAAIGTLNTSVGTAGFATNTSVGLALTGYYTKSETDAEFAINSSVNIILASDQAQLNALGYRMTILENPPSGYVTYNYVNGSLGFRDASIAALNILIQTHDASIFALQVADLTFATNVSVNAGIATLNTSVNTTLGKFVRSASMGYGLFWDGSMLDVSIFAGVTEDLLNDILLTIDESINLINGDIDTLQEQAVAADTSISWILQQGDVSINITYMDGSLARRDASIVALDILTQTHDASIGLLINADKTFATNASVGLVITTLDASIQLLINANNTFATNSSVGTAIQDFTTNTSIGLIVTTIDASIQLLIDANKTFATNASVGLAIDDFITIIALDPYATNASIGIALSAYVTNASFNNVVDISTILGPYSTNASVGIALGGFVRNNSIGFGLSWNTGTNKIDVSVNLIGVTEASLNAALLPYATNTSVGLALGTYTTNVSANAAFISDQLQINALGYRVTDLESSTGNVRIDYVDGSLFARDISIAWLNANKVNNASLGIYATNVSIGLAAFAKNASLGLYATNASVNTTLGLFLRNASLSTDFYWNTSHLLEVSTGFGGVTTGYVDGSLSRRDASIAALIIVTQNTMGDIDTLTSQVDILDSQLSGSIGYISIYNPLLTSSNLQFLNGALVNMGAANFIISASTGTSSHNNGFDIQLISGNPYNIDGAWAGQLYLRGGNARSGDVSSGMGNIYLIPGTRYSGSDIGTVFLGESTTPGTSRTIQSNGAGNIELILNPANSGAVTISNYSNTGGVRIHGVQISNATNKISLTRSNSFVTHMILDGGIAGGSSTWVAGHTVIKGGGGTNTAGYLNGGNVYIYPGLEASIGIRGNLYFGTETGVPMLTEVSTNKILFYNDASGGRITYGNVPAGVTSLRALTDVSVSVSISDKSFLQYDTSIGKWKDVSSLNAAIYFQEKATFGAKTSTGDGSMGAIAFDASYFYICTSTNKWGRLLIDTGVF